MGIKKLNNIIYEWSDEKEKILNQTRNLSFRDVIYAIEQGSSLLDILHHNQNRYLGQRKMILLIKNYPCEVPYTQDGNKLFLKTIIPNRKYKKVLKIK